VLSQSVLGVILQLSSLYSIVSEKAKPSEVLIIIYMAVVAASQQCMPVLMAVGQFCNIMCCWYVAIGQKGSVAVQIANSVVLSFFKWKVL
jgi:hypothetical protein